MDSVITGSSYLGICLLFDEKLFEGHKTINANMPSQKAQRDSTGRARGNRAAGDPHFLGWPTRYDQGDLSGSTCLRERSHRAPRTPGEVAGRQGEQAHRYARGVREVRICFQEEEAAEEA